MRKEKIAKLLHTNKAMLTAFENAYSSTILTAEPQREVTQSKNVLPAH